MFDMKSSILYIEKMERVRNRLKVLRVEKGDLTQQALADRVGCSRQTIHSIERLKFTPSVALALRLAQVLGVAVEDVFALDAAPGKED
jgi:putative transcriptional regulator